MTPHAYTCPRYWPHWKLIDVVIVFGWGWSLLLLFFIFIQFFKNVGHLLPFLHVACMFCVVCLCRLWSFPFVGFLLHMHCGNTFWVGIGVGESKVGWMDKVIGLCVSFLLAQVNGWACVDFGCTHPIDGLFWSLPIYLLGFFPKYECWTTNLIMFLYLFFWVVTCLFVSWNFISLWNVKNISYDKFLNEICLINL